MPAHRWPHQRLRGGTVITSVLLAAALLGPSVPASKPARIVAVGGSVTEIVYALGQEARLVARDTTSTFPPAAEKLPDVGYMRQLSPEGVISVNPDLILALEGSGPPEALSVLSEAGIPFVNVPGTPYDRQGLKSKILAVGKALGEEAAAESLAKKTDQAIEKAIAERPKAKAPKRVMFVLSTRGGRILAAGRETAAAGIIDLAGGKNVFDFSGYKPVTDEALLTADPEVIVRMSRPGLDTPHAESDDEIFSNPAVQQTTAGKARALVRVDGLMALGFGPRTAEAVADLARRMYAPAAP